MIALGKPRNKVVRARKFGRGAALLIRGVEPAVADVLHDGAGKKICILQHHADGAAQVRLFDFVDVDAVIADFAVRNVVKTVQKVGDGGFTRARSAYKSHLLPRLCKKRYIVEHRLVLDIAEVHVFKTNVARKLRVAYRAVTQGLLPCPKPRALVAFRKGAVFLFGVD